MRNVIQFFTRRKWTKWDHIKFSSTLGGSYEILFRKCELTGLTQYKNVDITCHMIVDFKDFENFKIIDKIIDKLKSIDIDGERMQYILEQIGMDDQMHRQLIMSKNLSDSEILLEEKKSILKI